MKIAASFVLVTGLFTAQALLAQNSSAPNRVTTVEGITEYRLANGLEVLLVAFVLAVTTLNLDDDDPDYYALWIANSILGGDTKSRLFKRIRDKDGLSYGVQTGYSAGTLEKFGTITFQAIANPANAPKVEAAFKEELAKALAEGFTAEEVEAAKTTFLQDNLLRMSQDAFVAQTLGRYTEFGRSMTRLTETRAKVAALTPATVNAAFKKWIDPAAISYFKGGDFKKAGVLQ